MTAPILPPWAGVPKLHRPLLLLLVAISGQLHLAESAGLAPLVDCTNSTVTTEFTLAADRLHLSLSTEGGMVLKSGPTILDIGRVTSIERNHVAVDEAEAGGPAVAVKIECDGNILVGRHFQVTDTLYAHVTRESINILKENFRDVLTKAEWKTVVKLKGVLGVD